MLTSIGGLLPSFPLGKREANVHWPFFISDALNQFMQTLTYLWVQLAKVQSSFFRNKPFKHVLNGKLKRLILDYAGWPYTYPLKYRSEKSDLWPTRILCGSGWAGHMFAGQVGLDISGPRLRTMLCKRQSKLGMIRVGPKPTSWAPELDLNTWI